MDADLSGGPWLEQVASQPDALPAGGIRRRSEPHCPWSRAEGNHAGETTAANLRVDVIKKAACSGKFHTNLGEFDDLRWGGLVFIAGKRCSQA